MSDIAIQVSGLSKCYHIGAAQQRKDSLRDWLAARFSRASYNARDEMIWALRNVSFEVKRGEVVGVIGRNGAGKSTLLKILSRITRPSEGSVRLYGRVGSLLEVGTGFHPELTGRENVYLSGAILGMTRQEIERNFEEIVDFAELEKFIDTPVKRYSSGMTVRLGFAVAAHLDPEILLVDEVLAVGDAAFQKKSLGRMDGVAQSGRTVLFVSHNMAMVNKICGRALLIEGGRLEIEGATTEVTARYLSLNRELADYSVDDGVNRAVLESQASDVIVIRGIELLTPDGASLSGRPVQDGLRIRIHYTAKRTILTPGFIIALRSHDGIELCRVSNLPISGYHIDSIKGDGTVEVAFDALPFTGGRYFVSLRVARAAVKMLSSLEDVARFDVASRDLYGSGLALNNERGYLFIDHEWRHQAGRAMWSSQKITS